MIDTTILPVFLRGFLLTIILACGGLFIGLLGGFIAGFATSRRLRVSYLASFFSFYTMLIRGTPLYLQILLIYFALPDLLFINISAFAAGVVTLGLNSIAYVSEIVRGGLNALRDDQWDAGYVLGYTKLQTIQYIVFPQLISKILPALTNELITLIKETSILSVIGLVELTRVAMNLSARTLKPMMMYSISALFYLFIIGIITILSRDWERRLHHDKR